jgi:hypothetical protein
MTRPLVALVIALCLTARAHAASSMTIAWNPNPEPVAGYIVAYGTSPGLYDTVVDVGLATTWTFGDALDGLTYYFVVYAYNATGVTSDPSAEVLGRIGAVPIAPLHLRILKGLAP